MTPNEIIKRLESIAASAQTAHYDVAEMARVAPEAAALIREMREMLRETQWSVYDEVMGVWQCRYCSQSMKTGHTPDCKLAQMLKD